MDRGTQLVLLPWKKVSSKKKTFQAKEMGEHFLMEEERRGDDESDEEVFQKQGPGFVISRKKAIALVVIVVVVTVFFAVISGVFSAKKARKDALKEIQRDKRQGDLSGSTSRSVINATDATTSVISTIPTSSTGSTPATTPTDHEPIDLKPWYRVRLPQNIRPIHYDLYLNPVLEQNTFQGNVSILMEVTAKSEFMSYILIHINDMNVTRATVHKHSGDVKSDIAFPGDEVALKRTFEYPQNDFFIFELKNDLEIGKYLVYMEYKSTFSSQLNGLYISTYTNEKGQKR